MVHSINPLHQSDCSLYIFACSLFLFTLPVSRLLDISSTPYIFFSVSTIHSSNLFNPTFLYTQSDLILLVFDALLQHVTSLSSIHSLRPFSPFFQHTRYYLSLTLEVHSLIINSRLSRTLNLFAVSCFLAHSNISQAQ